MPTATDQAVVTSGSPPAPRCPSHRARRVIPAYPAADSSAQPTPSGRTSPPPLPSTRTASPASAPATATAPPRPSRSPIQYRAPSAMITGPAPRVTTVPTARPVSRTAAKYAAWKRVKRSPVTTSEAAEGRTRPGAGRDPRTASTPSSTTSPPAHRQKDRASGPRSLARKRREAAAPAVPQAAPATTRYSRLRPAAGEWFDTRCLRACVKDERSRSSLRGQHGPARGLPGPGTRRGGAARARRREAEARSHA